MLKIKLNIQLFGADDATWTQGISVEGIQEAYKSFCLKCEEAVSAVENYADVDAALTHGWHGVDCEAYIAKFHAHAANVVKDINTYKEAVGTAVNNIISQWSEFQSGLIK